LSDKSSEESVMAWQKSAFTLIVINVFPRMFGVGRDRQRRIGAYFC
jgi:hypothetical protein